MGFPRPIKCVDTRITSFLMRMMHSIICKIWMVLIEKKDSGGSRVLQSSNILIPRDASNVVRPNGRRYTMIFDFGYNDGISEM